MHAASYTTKHKSEEEWRHAQTVDFVCSFDSHFCFPLFYYRYLGHHKAWLVKGDVNSLYWHTCSLPFGLFQMLFYTYFIISKNGSALKFDKYSFTLQINSSFTVLEKGWAWFSITETRGQLTCLKTSLKCVILDVSKRERQEDECIYYCIRCPCLLCRGDIV